MASDDSISNFYAMTGISTVAVQTAPATSIVAVILVTPKLSGLFDVDVDIGWSDNTNADTVTWRLRKSQVIVAGQVFTVGGTTPAAAGFAGLTAGGGASGFVQTAASGMTITNPAGGASAQTNLDSKVFNTLTGLLANSDQYYGLHGIVTAANPGVPFALGKQVALWLDVNAADNITIPSLTFNVKEMPWQ
jgi:hypothetical protein